MITLVFCVIVLAIVIPHLWVLGRKRLYRELVVFCLLMIPGIAFSYMAATLIIIEEPLFFLEWIYRPVNDLFSMFFPS
ncbi:hypothetical protein [Paenibacillus daejeonensis]|uniref:hypothetical protein n=1 Tax=Paenibacillus daejeonensis TaxID=135193 RepID=UPI000372E236|nr:hypothetical protein [Paenibacillus daejeonensis]